MIIFIILFALIIIFAIIYAIKISNDLIVRKNRIDNAWSQIDVQLKKRFDLIPNLVEVVKASANFENETLINITNARNIYVKADSVDEKIQANNILTNAMKGFLAVSENYPDLKSNANYNKLLDELSKIEEKIGYSRQFYNDTVLLFNNAIQVFPGNIFAENKGYKPAIYFAIDDFEKENIKISF